ncbi:MAG: Bor family protein [Vibrionaceae bacterium]
MKKVVLAATIALMITGCAKQSFTMQPGSSAKPTQEVAHHFFISGVGQSKNIDAAAVCGGAENVSRVEAQDSALNILLGYVTFGIYTPRQARVFCTR